MKNKTTIITLAVALLIVGASAFYLLTRDGDTTDPATNNDTNTAINSSEEVDVREAVWDQLSQEQQDRIDGTWQSGVVSETTLEEGATISNGDEIITVEESDSKEVYMIDFPVDTMAVPNNMIVYADMGSHAIIGYGLVD